MVDKKHLIITGSVLVAFFLISLLFFMFHQDGKVRRVLFFPEIKSGKLVTETRYIKKQKFYFQNIKALMEELLIGSALHGRTRIFPAGTKIISVLKKEKTVVLDLSFQILLEDEKAPLSFPHIIQTLVNNIIFNFKEIMQVIIYIDGELLEPEITKINGETKKIYMHKFDKKLLK